MAEPAHPEASPELEIATDLVKRALLIAPVAIGACGIVWGIDGLLSSAFGLGLVVANFLLAAGLMAWAGRISPVALGATVMGSYVIRLALITVAVLLVKDLSWVNLWPLCITLVVSHLALLVWEARYVSASLAYPGLKPRLTTLPTLVQAAAREDV